MNILSTTQVAPFSIVNGKLVESSLAGGYGRTITLSTLGKILRGYKTTKQRSFNKLKSIRVYYGIALRTKPEFAYSVKVGVNGTKNLSIGCVTFKGKNALALRAAALKSSKVLA